MKAAEPSKGRATPRLKEQQLITSSAIAGSAVVGIVGGALLGPAGAFGGALVGAAVGELLDRRPVRA